MNKFFCIIIVVICFILFYLDTGRSWISLFLGVNIAYNLRDLKQALVKNKII